MQAFRSIYGPWILTSGLNTFQGRRIGGGDQHRRLHQLIALKDAGAQLEQSGQRLPAMSLVHLSQAVPNG